QDKVQCVLWLAETRSVKRVQRRLRTDRGINPPTRDSIVHWDRQLRETDRLVCQTGKARKPRITQGDVDRVQASFIRSPRKSIRKAARQLNMHKSTVHDVVHKRLRLRCYKLQLLHALKPDDRPRRRRFAEQILELVENDETYLSKIGFSEYQRDTPKVNVWCCLLKTGVIGPFFFGEPTITATTYLDMLEQYAFPLLPPGTIFQQDGAPPDYSNSVRTSLNEIFPDSWIVRGDLTSWPPRSPDLIPLDFFLWGFVKNRVYQTPVADLADLRRRIVEVIALVTPEMLSRVWQEIEYRLDITRATNGVHVELH
ncbi:hypothetical protein C0J52_26409, partial [Blattella germanica]